MRATDGRATSDFAIRSFRSGTREREVSQLSLPLGDLVGCKPEAGYQQSPVLQTFEPRGEKGVCGKKFVACAAVATVTPLDVSLHEVEAGARAGVLYRSLGSDLANVK